MTFRVVAGRDDGLCMRLLALLNALRLADAYSADFGFFWPETDFPEQDQHTVSDRSQIFAPSYLADHLVPETERKKTVPVLSHGGPSLDMVISEARQTGMLVVERPGRIPLPKNQDGPTDAALFASIGWAEPVRLAIDAANALSIGSAASAIHIRGGDILHGSNSNSGEYAHKAASIFEVEALVGRLEHEGKTVWLIGQEHDLIAQMVNTHIGVQSLEQARADLGLSAVQSVFFDAVTMSRMLEVYGGNSGVARLACRLGGARFVDTLGLDLGLKPDAFLGDPLAGAAYADVSSNLKAHSYYKLFYLSGPADWTSTDLGLARLMLRWRPESQFARLVLCTLCAHFGLWDEDEALARAVIGPGAHEGWPDVVIHHVMAEFDPFSKEQIAVLAQAEPGNYPACAMIAACGQGECGVPLAQHLLESGLDVSPTLKAQFALQSGQA